MLATPAREDGCRAAISAAVATTQVTPRTMARELIAHGKRVEFLTPADFFNRFDRGVCFAFFARSVSLLSEMLKSRRSALSKYRIDRGAFFAFFTGTDILLVTLLESGPHRANRVPARDLHSPSRNPLWKRGLVP
jgi:hypothetical protein